MTTKMWAWRQPSLKENVKVHLTGMKIQGKLSTENKRDKTWHRNCRSKRVINKEIYDMTKMMVAEHFVKRKLKTYSHGKFT